MHTFKREWAICTLVLELTIRRAGFEIKENLLTQLYINIRILSHKYVTIT
jgi:hypothetical protein